MPATVDVIDEVAETALPIVFVIDQNASGTVVTAAVKLLEQHADIGAGSHAVLQILDMVVDCLPADAYEPVFFGAANGSNQWGNYQFYVSIGAGEWRG